MLRYRVAAPSIRIVPWAALASCWPLPQQLLHVSATGGGRRRCTLAIFSGMIIFISRLERPRLRSNESPSGAFKRQSGLRKQMEGLCPDKLCGALQTLFHG